MLNSGKAHKAIISDARKKGYVQWTISFLLLLGYCLSIAFYIVPTPRFSSTNLSIYAFSDLYFYLFSRASVLTFPITVIFLFSIKSIRNHALCTERVVKKIFIAKAFEAARLSLTVLLAVFMAYILSRGSNGFNLGFTDRSSLQTELTPFLALLIAQLYLFFYLTVVALIISVFECWTDTEWLPALSALVLSYLDTGVRLLLNSTKMVGVLPCDNVLVFYFRDYLYGITRPSYVYSMCYWILLILLLIVALHLSLKHHLHKVEVKS